MLLGFGFSTTGLTTLGTRRLGENILSASEDVGNTPWAVNSELISLPYADINPNGGNCLAVGIAVDGIGSSKPTTHSAFTLSDNIATISMYAADGGASQTKVLLYNRDQVIGHDITVTWTAGVPSFSAGNNYNARGIIDDGDGWHRIWFDVNLKSLNEQGDSFDLRIFPAVGTSTVDHATIVRGVQLETSRPLGAGPGRLRSVGDEVVGLNAYIGESENLSDDSWTAPATIDNTVISGGGLDGDDCCEITCAETGVGAFAQVDSDSFNLPMIRTYCMSACYKDAGAATSALRCYNLTQAVMHNIVVTWTDGVPEITSSGYISNSGVDDVGDGWYRVWFDWDLATDSEVVTDDFDVRVMPFRNDTIAGHGIRATRIQVEPRPAGVGPGPYLAAGDGFSGKVKL